MSAITLEQHKPQAHLPALKFALWVAIASMIMMFAALTSAYIVKKAGGNWADFRLPDIFALNTLIVLLSSGTMHLAYLSFKRNHFRTFRISLGVTLGLGLAFIIGQYQGWQSLANIGVHLDGNPSGSFLYVISGVHGLHIAGGLIALLITFVLSLIKSYKPIDELMLETNPDKNTKIQMLATYWHFVDILWVYLFLFFYFNHL